ncbi:hypothetical protein FOPG_16509 [Fusarium oxysporum f. sp. conglutinans race 2 54008]|uniref:Uncharacterized protein n=1 Tax=Fusarium oxysporum f. sp. conglutinans race 2 54008 TaxID=1089457 RepID=X0H625_FUSOX|nr:hypothetical protein FOPG_16509 [Fusarium oxysporum f. sp. conglutinans race 2 54008]
MVDLKVLLSPARKHKLHSFVPPTINAAWTGVAKMTGANTLRPMAPGPKQVIPEKPGLSEMRSSPTPKIQTPKRRNCTLDPSRPSLDILKEQPDLLGCSRQLWL